MGQWGGCPQVWDAETGELLQTLKGHTDDVRSMCWSPDEVTLVSTSLDKSVRCWRSQWTPDFQPLQPHVNGDAKQTHTAKMDGPGLVGVNGWASALSTETPLDLGRIHAEQMLRRANPLTGSDALKSANKEVFQQFRSR